MTFIACHPDSREIFSVRSAYHIQWTHISGTCNGVREPGGSTTLAVWSSLWKIQVPRKVQIFGRRALDGIIPLKSILTNRHIGIDGVCPSCHQGEEDLKHLLFRCNLANELWNRLGVMDIIDDAVVIDRPGYVILEHLLLLPESQLHIMQNL